MRIVDRATFLALPPGTLFAKYEPCTFGELAIKGETVADIDFTVFDLVPWFENTQRSEDYIDAMRAMEAGETSPPLDFHCDCRDGLFDKDQLFAVFDKPDVEGLIARLTEAVHTGYA